MSDDSISVAEKSAQFNLQLIVGWINFADNKAGFLMTVALAIVGLSLADVPAATTVCANCWQQSRYVPLAFVLLTHVFFYATAGYTIVTLLKIVRPTLTPQTEKKSWFYFQSIAAQSGPEFEEWARGLSGSELSAQLIHQIFENSVIAAKKFEQISKASLCLGVTVLAGLVAVVPALVGATLIEHVAGN